MSITLLASFCGYLVKGMCGFANTLVFDAILSFWQDNIEITPVDLPLSLVSNLLMAFVFFVISDIFLLIRTEPTNILCNFFYYVGYINVCLAIFNLIPVPPLDGSRIATAILPDKYYYTIMRYERYIMIGLFVLIMTPAVSGVLSTVYGWVSDGIEFLADLPFRLFGLL